MTLRVAIIEDSADLLDELLAFLRHRGFDAWGVRSAEAFWRQLHRDPVDIVLIDIGLPGEDGFSVLDYLHEIGQFGLVVVTARGHEQDRLQALNAGADLYLIKPVNFSDLAESIQALGSRLRQQKPTERVNPPPSAERPAPSRGSAGRRCPSARRWPRAPGRPPRHDHP